MSKRHLNSNARSRPASEKTTRERLLSLESPASPASETPPQPRQPLKLPTAKLSHIDHTSAEARSNSSRLDTTASGDLPVAVAGAAATLVSNTSKRLTRANTRRLANEDLGSDSGSTVEKTISNRSPSPSVGQYAAYKRQRSRKRMANTDAQEIPERAATQSAKRRKTNTTLPRTSASERAPTSAGPVSSPKGKAVARMSARPTQVFSNALEEQSSMSHYKTDEKEIESKDAPPSGISSHCSGLIDKTGDLDIAMAGTDEIGSELTSVTRERFEDGLDRVSAEDDDKDDDDDNENENENEDPEFDDGSHRYSESELGDPFGAGASLSYRRSGLPVALSMLGGMLSMSGMSARFREILAHLGRKDDPSLQLIALQDLSEILLVSNEDNLSGSFSPDAYVRALVSLMQPNEITGEENPEIMLLACRCLANLMEAIPASAANVVYGGAVPVLCQKLLEISFIDLAEQSLSTLERISLEYPSCIVQEGGLTACLSYLEFFATSTQRTAVTLAANCCRNLSEDSFSVVLVVMPILLNVLNGSDQRVVEQASLCVCRIVESFRHSPSELEKLVDVDMLKAILRLLLPGTATHSIGSNLHTQFLRVLAIIADASPRLAAELFKMDVVETLYQILTGLTPPAGIANIAENLDSILIMQALTSRPRDQVIETLNVICNLLPSGANTSQDDAAEDHLVKTSRNPSNASRSKLQPRRKKPTIDKIRLKFLEGCQDNVRRFTLILLPTLSDVYSSTVNFDVRLRVMTAHVGMLSNFDTDIITEALKEMPYASFLASILSQQDHPSLVCLALQATDLLMCRLEKIYRYQLYREGVISEIENIASSSVEIEVEALSSKVLDSELIAVEKPEFDSHSIRHRSSPGSVANSRGIHESSGHGSDHDYDETCGGGHDLGVADGSGTSDLYELSIGADIDSDVVDHKSTSQIAGDIESHDSSNEDGTEIEKIDEDAEGDNDNQDCEEGGIDDENPDDIAGSPPSSCGSNTSHDFPPRHQHVTNAPLQTQVKTLARRFLVKHETGKNDNTIRLKATQTLSGLSSLASEISDFYLEPQADASAVSKGIDLFKRLAVFFDSNVFENATSAELLGSNLVHVLERVLGNADYRHASAARSAFLECFIGHPVTQPTGVSPTPFSVLVHKLQDLLSRSENFEIVTVHNNTFDGNQTSAASMLAKQIRLRLVADNDPDIPLTYKNIMVSIHAIATFKTLEEYLRPRIDFSVQTRNLRRDGLSRALAAISGSNEVSTNTSSTATAARLAMERSSLLSGAPPRPDVPSDQSAPAISDSRQTKPASQNPRAARPRSHRKTEKSKSAKVGQLNTITMSAGTVSDTEEKNKGRPRRSTRHHAAASRKSRSPQEIGYDASANDPERKRAAEATDDSEINNIGAMNAGIGGLDEDMTADAASEALSPNVKIADGGSIATRKERTTHASKPSRPQSSVKYSDNSASALTSALRGDLPAQQRSMASRPTLLDSVVQSSQDWHMEFTLDGKPVPIDSTVYRAVFDSGSGRDKRLKRPVWSTVHTIHYRRVSGPQPSESANCVFTASTQNDSGNTTSTETANSGCSDGINNNVSSKLQGRDPSTLSILGLLKTLHELNANVGDNLVANGEVLRLKAEPVLQFVNTKLTAKLNRQLEEPLIVASNCLPNWSEDLARLYPFLFPFETRRLFLQSTSFGYARSMARWQDTKVQEGLRRDRRDERPFLGRLQRQKVRISRSKILESAVKVMDLYGASQSILEVEYFDEVGTGLGPTLEFYSTVSREFSKKKYRLWRESDTGDSEFVSSPSGLFPRPVSEHDTMGINGGRLMSLFEALGKFVARSMLDSRIIDINFNPIFFRIGAGSSSVRPTLGAVNAVDSALARSLLLIQEFATAKKAIEGDATRSAVEKVAAIAAITINNSRIEDYSLDFTLPGYPDIELIPGGSQTSVTIDNVGTYVERVVSMTLEDGVRRQVEAFQRGFSQVFPYSALSAFTPDELVSLFGCVEEDWSLEALIDSVKADHGYNMDSRSVRNLLQVMSEMSLLERRDFLMFTTGSPRLPIGGFRSLTPTFTVVCKPSEAPYSSDDYLPSVMTCVNYLKLPNYSTIDILRKQLSTAVKEGQGAFHLS